MIIVTDAARRALPLQTGEPLLAGRYWRIDLAAHLDAYLRQKQWPGETMSDTILRLVTVGFEARTGRADRADNCENTSEETRQ
jgi:hypothetical protein